MYIKMTPAEFQTFKEYENTFKIPMHISEDTGELLIKEDDAINAIFGYQMLKNVLSSLFIDTESLKEALDNTA